MSSYKLPRLLCYARTHSNAPTKSTRGATRLWRKHLANYSTNSDSKASNGSLWHSIIRRWEWTVPVGVGVTVLGILQWRHLRKHPYTAGDVIASEPFNDFVINCYCHLPLRATSRVWGWIASRELPVALRPTLYGFYAKAFRANLEEIDLDLATFPSLVDFFVRPLKDGVRPVAQNTNIVSPSDGKVLHFGPVTSCRVEQVKGVTYNLRHFLGEPSWMQKDKPGLVTKRIENDSYIDLLLKNPANRLYQLTVYLAPGDYHRFHSPTDWRIDFRRHFRGKLLSVNPMIASWLPDLFSLNERAVYIGEWSGGFMAYAAIGATNVGSIKIYRDDELVTNAKRWIGGKDWEDLKLNGTDVSKGETFGEFRMGSTIVLLFEAPKDFQFCLKTGQAIKVGQPLAECFVNAKQR